MSQLAKWIIGEASGESISSVYKQQLPAFSTALGNDRKIQRYHVQCCLPASLSVSLKIIPLVSHRYLLKEALLCFLGFSLSCCLIFMCFANVL